VCTSSEHGTALVVETQPGAGGHVLGFKLEPRETLDYVHKELTSLMQV
jgi:Bardet-Biedl syndrome 5 protein